MIKVSVIIPVYNAEKYLRDCLESIRNQSLKDIEVITVEDGSIDKSLDILNEYAALDNRFCVIKQDNQFAGIARNNGMKIARGEYIIFLDADDFFKANMLEEMYNEAKENGSDIVLCDANFFDTNTKEIQEPSWILRTEYLPQRNKWFSYKDIPDRIFQISIAVPWNKLYKKTFIEKKELLFQGTKRSNDEYFVGMSFVLAEKISTVNKRLVNYRVNNIESLQGMGNPNEVSMDFYTALLAIHNELIARGIYRSVEKRFVNKFILSLQL